MMRPEQTEQSRYLPDPVPKKQFEDPLITGNNNSTIQDHSIFVEMPNNISAKNSARTGYHFYKNSSLQNSAQKNTVGRGGGFNQTNEESPQRVNKNNSNDTLPNLNIKVN